MRWARATADLALAAFSLALALRGAGALAAAPPAWFPSVWPPVWPVFLGGFGVYSSRRLCSPARVYGRLAEAFLFHVGGLAALIFFLRLPLAGEHLLRYAVFLGMGAILIEGLLGRRGLVGSRVRGGLVIVGANPAGWRLAERVAAHPELGLDLVAFLDDDPAKRGRRFAGAPVVGTVADLESVLADPRVTEVAVALPESQAELAEMVVLACREAGVPVSLVLDAD